ncbi:hypothetical protein AAVH_40397, partial [Aphelenchoides avenae]
PTSGPLEYVAYVNAYVRHRTILGSEQVFMSGLKAALSVSHIKRCTFSTPALSESLCSELSQLFGGISAETVRISVATSDALEFLLCFESIEQLGFGLVSVGDDIPDDFVLRCRAKRIKTLKLHYPHELQLQEPSEEELIQQFRAIKPMIPLCDLDPL